MKVVDIPEKFEDIESRLKSLEATQHTHDGESDADPIEAAVEETAEAVEETLTEVLGGEAEDSTPETEEPPPADIPEEESVQEESDDQDARFQPPETKAADSHGDLKMDIQADVKEYDANTIAQALLHEVIAPKDNRNQCREKVMVIENGETIPVQPFRLTDSNYKVVSRDMLTRILEETAVDAIQWQAEGYDCEDIARKFVTRCCDLGINSVGRVMAWSGSHAFCVAIVQDGASVDFVFVEPQTDQIVEKFEGMYDISDALIIIS